MARNVGLWIDHKHAFIIWQENREIQVIPSNVEPRVRGGGTRIGGLYNQGLDSELGYNDRHEHQLHEFYGKVIDSIRTADHILVLGPGEAKFEFEKALQKHKGLCERLLKVETADKLTEHQMAARVRDFYTRELVA
jgi:hypothetical protein